MKPEQEMADKNGEKRGFGFFFLFLFLVDAINKHLEMEMK